MLAATAYVVAITAANLSVAAFGPWISPLNALVLIGLDLSLRDYLHDRWQGAWLWPRMLGLIATGGFVSFALNPAAGRIAAASCAAFVISGIVDAAAYHLLRSRPYLERSNGSNVFGAAVDSALFPTLAFGVFIPTIVALQFAAKIGGGFLWSLALSWATGKRKLEQP